MEIYFDPRHPASFTSPSILRKHADKKFTVKRLKDFLSRHDAYTLHKPVRKRFKRRKIFTLGINDLYQADLADLSSLSKYNDNYKFLLVVIDVFSKKAWVYPLKNKSAKTVTEAFTRLFERQQPAHLQTDKGTEFVNSQLQKLLKDKGINFYTSENEDIKAACAERFCRTLKTKMWKYFTFVGNYRYIDVLDDLVDSYNDTYHSTIKMAPNQVTRVNEDEIRKRNFVPKRPPVWKLKIGDKVRISKGKRDFKKGYLANWSAEIFSVVSRHPSDPPVYEIEDYSGEKIRGKFYDFELQKVIKEDDVYKIEKVLKTRKRNGKKEYYVKWFDYPDKFNSWVTDIKRV